MGRSGQPEVRSEPTLTKGNPLRKGGQNLRVFVKNKRGKSIGMTTPQKARILVKQNKARPVGYRPYVIQLTVATGETVQDTHLGIDLGSRFTGLAITSQNKVLSSGDIEWRQDVKVNLETRKMYRRSRRSRKTRYRRCKFKVKTKRVYDEVKKKWIKQRISFVSSRPQGWLPPSIQSRITNTFTWINRFLLLIPKCHLHIEVGKFDIAKLINPNIQGIDYQRGQTYGYYDVRYYVFARDNYTCQVCNKKGGILNTHHLLYRSCGGSDRADNLITVCTECHTYENHQKGQVLWRWMKDKKKTRTSYREGPFMNTLRKRIFSTYPNARITYGSETTPHRKTLGLDKSHANDAVAITGIEKIREKPKQEFVIKQFRKKKRSLHEATARKGRKTKNIESKRNEKNTPHIKGWHLNDCVELFGQVGYLTGFTGGRSAYIKNIDGDYIAIPNKTYKQVPLKELSLCYHNNNWQYEVR